ncbi:MAG: glycosyltransferase family 2 protein [Elusimicrobia bacterium]|nr:glycosyltransferase family 2 protein [Elusimicrobiota bacterium]
MADASPRVSVVIDNHNYGRFLAAAIDSALSQDVPHGEAEVVVVDDGSTDGSRDVIRSYGDRVRPVLLDPRRGQAEAFNAGIAAARGEIVCLLDSDDVWLHGKLAKVVALFDDPVVGVVQHWLDDVSGDLKSLGAFHPAWPRSYSLDDFLEARAHFTATSGLSFRRKALLEALPIPKELFYYLDDFLTVKTLFKWKAANIPEVLGLHRVHGGNWCASGLTDPAKIELDFRMRELFGASLKGWLAGAGRSLSPGYKAREELELLRRRVLHAGLRARPVEAWRLWLEGFAAARRSSFGRFRLGSLLLAVLSPTLYLSAYAFYSDTAGLKGLRLRLFPETNA